MKHPQDLHSRQYPENAIEAPARRLGVEMTADGNGGEARLRARQDSKHVADVIDLDGAAERPAFRCEPFADLRVRCAQRKTVHTGLAMRTDAGGRENVGP
ncbi:hypothetical protein D9M68_785650 [compost metagenome]